MALLTSSLSYEVHLFHFEEYLALVDVSVLLHLRNLRVVSLYLLMIFEVLRLLLLEVCIAKILSIFYKSDDTIKRFDCRKPIQWPLVPPDCMLIT